MELLNFKDYLLESGDSGGANQKAGIGLDGKNYKFHINDLIKHASTQPVKPLSVKPLHQKTQQMKSGNTGESETGLNKRVANADLKHPIIVTKHPTQGHVVLDGTHRLQKAHSLGHEHINSVEIPWKEMQRYEK